MKLYRSVCDVGEAEYIVQKSRFITHVKPIESYEEGQAFVAEIKQEYKGATHNVPAIVFGHKQEMQWASDDGEPSGTSGLPMLKMITDEGLTNLAVVVTRYFGGIKLGTGGLSRAYTTAAKLGLEAAGICDVEESCTLTYDFDYSLISVLQNRSKDGKFQILNTRYTDKVRADLVCITEEIDNIKAIVADISSGQANLIEEKSGVFRNRVE